MQYHCCNIGPIWHTSCSPFITNICQKLSYLLNNLTFCYSYSSDHLIWRACCWIVHTGGRCVILLFIFVRPPHLTCLLLNCARRRTPSTSSRAVPALPRSGQTLAPKRLHCLTWKHWWRACRCHQDCFVILLSSSFGSSGKVATRWFSAGVLRTWRQWQQLDRPCPSPIRLCPSRFLVIFHNFVITH